MEHNQPPAHLVANNPEELRLLMIANNFKHGRRFHYFDFQSVKGKWYCWFEIREKTKIDQASNGDQ